MVIVWKQYLCVCVVWWLCCCDRNRNDEDDCRGSISSSLGLKDVLILFNWFPSICLTYFLKRIFCETGMKHYSGDLEVFVDTCSSFWSSRRTRGKFLQQLCELTVTQLWSFCFCLRFYHLFWTSERCKPRQVCQGKSCYRNEIVFTCKERHIWNTHCENNRRTEAAPSSHRVFQSEDLQSASETTSLGPKDVTVRDRSALSWLS